MSDEAQTYTMAWIYTFDRRTDRLISRRKAGAQELRDIQEKWSLIEEPLNSPDSSPGDGPCGGDTVTTYTYTYYEEAPPPRFRFEHDPAARVFRITTADGIIETFRDNPTRYLCLEPDPDTGAMRPVTKRGQPVYLYLAREDREAR